MPDRRTHRGPDPRDRAQFGPTVAPRLREAVADLSWLLSKGYAETSALKLVGDRYRLTERQRLAVRRCSCSDQSLQVRLSHRVTESDLRDQPLWIDGFNVLTTVEAALGGAVVLEGRDGAYRDLAGIHGSYRNVEETLPAILLLGDFLESRCVRPCVWFLDRPVSNSGRLRRRLLDVAVQKGWCFEVELVLNPDAILSRTSEVVATADSVILDRCQRWYPLAREALQSRIDQIHLIPLSDPSTSVERHPFDHG